MSNPDLEIHEIYVSSAKGDPFDPFSMLALRLLDFDLEPDLDRDLLDFFRLDLDLDLRLLDRDLDRDLLLL